MHEVGHTLGLRHNFRASRVYTQQQLADPAFTRANGITGSVMEYAPINLTRRRAARALRDAVQRHARPVRLLGDRVRVQAAAVGPLGRRRARRAREDRRPQRRAAARLRHRRRQLHRRRSRDAAVRPRQRRHRLRQEADRDRPGAAEAPGDADASPRPGLQRPKRSVSYALATSPAPPTCFAPDRRRAHAARRAGHRPRPADRRCRRRAARGARPHHRQPARRRQLRVSPALQRKLGTDFSERTEALRSAATARRRPTTRRRPGARPAALAARRDDERHGRDAPAREQREGADRRRPRAAHARAVRPADAGGLERARRPRRHRAAAPRGAARPRQPHRALLIRPGARPPRRHAQHRPHAGAVAARANPRRHVPPPGPERREPAPTSPTAPTRSSRRSRPGCSAAAPEDPRRRTKTAARGRPSKKARGAPGGKAVRLEAALAAGVVDRER